MRAIVYKKYGGPEVLQLTQVPKPVPGKNQVLIKVHATDVSAADWRMRKADPWMVRLLVGLFRPKKFQILGGDVAGVVEQVGSDVKHFKVGDKVFASCGFDFGGYAEYIAITESPLIALMPENMEFEEAATVPSNSVTALRFLRSAGIKRGQQVMIYGASGSVGTFAVQIAHLLGATVTGVCSTKNIEIVKSLGAQKVLDYTKQDFSLVPDQYDIIFDAVGKAGKPIKNRLATDGKFITVNSLGIKGKGTLAEIKDYIESWQLKTIIDRTYRLDQIVEAHTYVEQFHKKGNVVVEVFKEDT